jgi:ketosteroid isomerase-like protein
MTLDEGAVLRALEDFGSALNARDVEASMATLEPAADLTVIPSEGVDVHRGPHAARAFLERIYAGPKRYRWEWRERWVSVIGDAASIVAVGEEIVEEGGEAHRLPYCLTGIARRRGDAWRLVVLHASEDRSQARKVDGSTGS